MTETYDSESGQFQESKSVYSEAGGQYTRKQLKPGKGPKDDKQKAARKTGQARSVTWKVERDEAWTNAHLERGDHATRLTKAGIYIQERVHR